MDPIIFQVREIKSENKNKLLILSNIIKTMYIIISVIVTCYIKNPNIKSNCLAFELLLFGIFCDYIESAIINYNKLKETTNFIDEQIKINIEKLPEDIKDKINKLLSKHYWTPYKRIRDTVFKNNDKYLMNIKPEIEKHSQTTRYLVIGSVIIALNIVYFLILHFSKPSSTLYIQMEALYKIIIHIPWIYCFFYFSKLYNDSGLSSFIDSKKSKNYFKNR